VVKYPDFVISKVIAMPPHRDRVRHILGVVEIKINQQGTTNITTSSHVQAALKQLLKYYRFLSQMPHAVVPNGAAFPSYLLYGTMYTRLVFRDGPGGIRVLYAQPWQEIFHQ